MSDKTPTAWSKTSEACTCRFLESAAAEPHGPFVFDERLNEYHARYTTKSGGEGHYLIYHCPRCGGVAARSKRERFFAVVTNEESRRLLDLTRGLKTITEAIARLGEPDEDVPDGYRSSPAEKDGAAPEVRSYRIIRFKRLSETVDVDMIDFGPESGLQTTLRGKYLGKPRD